MFTVTLILASVASTMAAPAGVVVHKPEFDSAVIQHQVAGGNFAYSSDWAQGLGVETPLLQQRLVPQAVTYTQHAPQVHYTAGTPLQYTAGGHLHYSAGAPLHVSSGFPAQYVSGHVVQPRVYSQHISSQSVPVSYSGHHNVFPVNAAPFSAVQVAAAGSKPASA